MDNGIVMVFTGNGKGKTTAALGLCMRAAGWGKKVCIVQFLKSPSSATGERHFCNAHDIELLTAGIGFSWEHTPLEQWEGLKKAWALACEKLADASYDLIVLDEILGALQSKAILDTSVFSEQRVIQALQERPTGMDVALTGRGAPPGLIDYADLVTQMKMIKHPYEKGTPARAGIEY